MPHLSNLEMGLFRYSQPLPLFLCLLCVFDFSLKYTDCLVKGSFTSGFMKLKYKTYPFAKSCLYKLAKSSAVLVCLN